MDVFSIASLTTCYKCIITNRCWSWNCCIHHGPSRQLAYVGDVWTFPSPSCSYKNKSAGEKKKKCVTVMHLILSCYGKYISCSWLKNWSDINLWGEKCVISLLQLSTQGLVYMYYKLMLTWNSGKLDGFSMWLYTGRN